ncbi:cation/H(+) antiporter 15-like [Quercus robur]|uniref:cation/H(+) antiporter 15-like n=1 Tax=Quercus robur TaxID=38942 RepID=UPI002162234E|nr:cation/H(+) antiporter 15-like [Quercus robur]
MAEMQRPYNETNSTIVCYAPTMITTNGIWQGDNPLDYSLPLFILQLTMVVVTTRVLVFLLKPFRQPRVISEVLGGVILGPSVLGRSATFAQTMFPLRSVMVVETLANMGLLYFLFLVGVEMDITAIRRTGKKSLAIALSGMVLPFVVGSVFAFFLYKSQGSMTLGTYILFFSLAVSVTAFPVLARILAELKLVNSEIGKIALSSALVNDMCAWILLAFAIALSENDSSSLASLWVILSSILFVVFCIFVVRPAISWMIQRTPDGETISEFYICLILTGVMISGFITDAIGTHSVFGAFVFGLVIPNGPVGVTLIEKLEDFVSGLLLPLFFAISGLKTDIRTIRHPSTWGYLFLVIFLACAGKVIGTLLMSLIYRMTVREGVTLGFLMNTKGLVELIVLNVGRDQEVLDVQSFSLMVVAAIIMTAIVMPVVTTIYTPARRFFPYKRRTIQSSKPDAEFRVLVCIHNPRNVPTIINLLEASHPTKRSPICIYALHLVELTGRASAMLIVHNTRKSGRQALNRTQAQSDHIINAFENYEQRSGCVSVNPLTAISPYSSMHEDICNLAEDKRVGLIIIPFHKQQTVDGGMEAKNPAYQMVNKKVLANAPCSVGILIDRGLNGSTRLAAKSVSHHIAVLFFGGPDDREALFYAWRMSEHPGVRVTVLRLIIGEDAIDPAELNSGTRIRKSEHIGISYKLLRFFNGGDAASEPATLAIKANQEREKKLDEDLLKKFQIHTSNNESIMYIEKVVNNGEDTVAAIRSIESSHDLFIVGRGQGMTSPLTAGLTDWSECPELGAIGDLLASSDFASTVSVLVVQQFVGTEPQEDDLVVELGSMRHSTLDGEGPSEPPRGQNAFRPYTTDTN